VVLVFLTEGIQKYLLPDLFGTGRLMKIEFGNPAFWVYFIGSFEIRCVTLVLFGHHTPVPLFIIMTVVFVSIKYTILIEKSVWIFAHEYWADFAMTMQLLLFLYLCCGSISFDKKLIGSSNN
jgi:putative oxidoreductase